MESVRYRNCRDTAARLTDLLGECLERMSLPPFPKIGSQTLENFACLLLRLQDAGLARFLDFYAVGQRMTVAVSTSSVLGWWEDLSVSEGSARLVFYVTPDFVRLIDVNQTLDRLRAEILVAVELRTEIPQNSPKAIGRRRIFSSASRSETVRILSPTGT